MNFDIYFLYSHKKSQFKSQKYSLDLNQQDYLLRQ